MDKLSDEIYLLLTKSYFVPIHPRFIAKFQEDANNLTWKQQNVENVI
jgi:hypothetical protein